MSYKFHSLFFVQIIEIFVLELVGTFFEAFHVLDNTMVPVKIDFEVTAVAETGKR